MAIFTDRAPLGNPEGPGGLRASRFLRPSPAPKNNSGRREKVATAAVEVLWAALGRAHQPYWEDCVRVRMLPFGAERTMAVLP